MNPSPLMFSMTFVASISVLTAGVAWSAYDAQTKQAALTGKSKALKARIPKPKQYYARPARSIPATDSVTIKLIASPQLATLQPAPASVATPVVTSAVPSVAAQSATPAYVGPASSDIAKNPYFANQPAAILPLAARPAATGAAARAVAVPPVIAPVVAASALSLPTPAAVTTPSAAPMKAAPAILPAAAAPAVTALPSLEPPIYRVPPAAAPVVAANPYSAPFAVYQPWNRAATSYQGAAGNRPANPYLNPYLSYPTPQPQAVAAPVSVQPTNPANAYGSGNFKLALPSLPSFPSIPGISQSSNSSQFNTVAAASGSANSSIFSTLKMMIPLTGDANILPTIKKVYPTGEKPLVVLNFKCPTEVVGITPPPMMLLHEAVNFGFDGLNKTNLLSFNLQQVCS